MRNVTSILLSTLILGAAIGCSDDEKRPSGTVTPAATTPGADPTAPVGTTPGTTATSTTPGVDGGPPVIKSLADFQGEVGASMMLTNDKDYLMKGVVFVKAGVTLTIQKGTTIKGDNGTKAVLVVQPGGKIIAEGTADEPIVFTSQAKEGMKKAGDWGGIIVLGNAPINVPGGTAAIEGVTTGGTYGGTAPDDNSGVLSYVRIEYSGIQLSPNNEVNGLTLGGVGRGTRVDHVQVRHTLDDCFEFFGGTVNAKYLACQYNQDDGLDWDFGFSGKIQFFVLQQDPNTADDTNGFEGDNDAQGSTNLPQSEPYISNVTLCGHNKEVAKQQYGMLLRRNTKAHISNVVALGFEAGIDVRDALTGQNAKAGLLEVKSSIFFGSVGTGVLENVAYAENGGEAPNKDNDGTFDELAWFKASNLKNAVTDPGIPGCFDANSPVFGPATSLTADASVLPSDSFFDASAKYIGAFKDAKDTWATTGRWVVWKAD